MLNQILCSGVFFLIAMLASMIGIGGGVFYVPVLIFFGMPVKQAVFFSLFLIFFASMTAFFNYLKNSMVDWKLALIIDPATDIMAFVGGYYCALFADTTIKTILAVVLLLAGFLMMRKKNYLASIKDSGKSPFYIWKREFRGNSYQVNIPLIIISCAGVGFLAGLLGISGGVIKMPLMVIVCGVPMTIAAATSSVMVAITALCGILGHAMHSTIDYKYAIFMSLFTIAGGFTGSKIALKRSPRFLQVLFGVTAMSLGIVLYLKK